MADYRERLQSKMQKEEEREKNDQSIPPSPYTPIGQPEPASGGREGPQFYAAAAATLGNLVMGTCIGWSSPAGPFLARPEQEGGFNLSDEENSWVGCLMPAGALIGGQVGGLLMARMGRKGAMMTGAAMFAISYLMLVVAPNVWVIYVGRLCTGICTGICSIVCPVYVAETSTAARRGFLGSCVQLMVTIGVMLVYVMGLCGSWRWISISCLFMVALWIIALVPVPETPAHYISKKKYREAREALEWLRGTSEVEQEYETIRTSVEESAGLSAGFGDLFSGSNLAPFIISLWLMLGQQFSGMNAVMFYCVSIFEQTGSSMNSNVENIIVGGVQIFATILAALLMDKAGRRLLLNLSSSIMVISIGALGAFFYIADDLDNEQLAKKIEFVPVFSLSLFVFAFSIGFGPIPWLMMSELFSPEVKSLASSISTSFNWTLAFLVTKFFSTMVTAVHESGAFWMFGGFTILTFLFCFLFVPETKGKGLNEIQQLFRADKPYFFNVGPWKFCRGESAEDERPLADAEVY